MANPFRFGQVVSGELFCNRKAEIKQIAQNLAGGQSIVLYSRRRYGKTSLINAASDAIKGKNVLFGYADLFSCNSTEKILLAIAKAAAKAIVDDLKSIEKFLKSTTHLFNRIRFSVKFDTDEAGSISILPELSSKATGTIYEKKVKFRNALKVRLISFLSHYSESLLTPCFSIKNCHHPFFGI